MSGLKPLVQTCILACSLMTGWAATDTVPSKSDLLPSLQRQPMTRKSAGYYLASGEDWWPGGVPQISVLMAEQPLVFHIEPAGSKAGLQSVRLLFKCSSADSEFEEALLESAVQNSTQCRPLRPFKLERVSSSLYRLTLLRENQVPFEQALRHSLELRLRLSFYQGVLESASLFIFNFDALSKIPDNSRIAKDSNGLPLCRDCPTPSAEYTEFLHPRSYHFVVSYWSKSQIVSYKHLAKMSRNQSDFDYQGFVQILRDEFVNVIKLAQPMVRNLLTVTLFYSMNCSDSSQKITVLATAGVGRTADQNSLKAMKEIFLDLDTGVIYVTSNGYAHNVRLMNYYFQCACLSISIKGEIWSYYRSFLVSPASFRASNYFKFTTIPPLVASVKKPRTQNVQKLIRNSRDVSSTESKEPSTTKQETKSSAATTSERYKCYLPDNRTSSTIQLPANLYNLSLECPVFCDGDFRVLVGFEGIHCSRQNSRVIDGRPPCSRFIYFSPYSCEIHLVGPTSQMHSGNYTILIGQIRYTYHVTVISLPVFTPDSLGAETQFLNLQSAPTTLGCAVTYFGIQPVDIVPQFRLLERFRPGLHWTRVSPRIFGDTVLDGNPQSVVLSTNRTDTRSEVSVRVRSRKTEAWWVSWKATFECSASVAKSEALLFGLPEYRVRATWVLAYDRESEQRKYSSVAEPSLAHVVSLRFVLVSVFAAFAVKKLLY